MDLFSLYAGLTYAINVMHSGELFMIALYYLPTSTEDYTEDYMVTDGNAGQCNDVGEEVSPDGFGARPAASLGKYVDQGEDLVLANTLQGREFHK